MAVNNGKREAAKLLITYTLRKDPKAQKPAFFEDLRRDELSRHFDACRAEIEKMKTCNDVSRLREGHISLYKLFYAENTKIMSYLSHYLYIKKCIEKIEEHRDEFPVYHDFLKEQVIKVENTKLIREKFAKSLQDEGLKFDEYGVNKIFSYLDRNDIINRLAKACVPKKKASCEASEIKNLAKSQTGSRKSLYSSK